MFCAFILAGIASWSWSAGWFGYLLLAETLLALPIYFLFRYSLTTIPWPSLE